MTVLEFLASQLDREISKFDTQAGFVEEAEFWELCLEAREILYKEKFSEKKEKNVTDKG